VRDLVQWLIKALLSIRWFSALVIQVPLRRYQVAAADAVVDSCINNRGLEFLWVFPRQSGKDETVAQTVVFLLTLYHQVEAGMVHSYPTSGQLATGVDRLERRLDNLLTGGRWWGKGKPTRRGFGLAQCAFFSGHPQARAEGATANLLLIINECQDQDEAIVERRFTAMRASTNATALYVGTVRSRGDYLWKVRERLEKLQREDGWPRVFIVSPEMVGKENPHYAEFVAGQVTKFGRHHPIVKTEYFNEPIDTAAGLFPARRRALMRGSHPRLQAPVSGEVYLAIIDVGGQDEAAAGGWGLGLDNPARDYTVCHICRVVRHPEVQIGPVYQAVDVFVDHGSRHFQESPGQPSLFNRLLAYLRHWNVVVVVSDMTGVGQGITDALQEAYKRTVFGFDFAKSYGKARLGSDFLAVIETGRFQYWADGYDEEGSDCWWFFTQCEYCGYELGAGLPIERGLRWGVSPTARVALSGERGATALVHDDRLLSAALIAEVDRLVREGQIFLTTGESAVIRPEESGERGAWS
jgi:hypothetical protein